MFGVQWKALERRIGLRRDATRAPVRGPEWQGADSMQRPPLTTNQTPPDISLLRAKNGLDNGVHFILFYYLSDLTRYRPVHFERFLEGKYGPQIGSILDERPRQFLFLMASELLEREVAPASLA